MDAQAAQQPLVRIEQPGNRTPWQYRAHVYSYLTHCILVKGWEETFDLPTHARTCLPLTLAAWAALRTAPATLSPSPALAGAGPQPLYHAGMVFYPQSGAGGQDEIQHLPLSSRMTTTTGGAACLGRRPGPVAHNPAQHERLRGHQIWLTSHREEKSSHNKLPGHRRGAHMARTRARTGTHWSHLLHLLPFPRPTRDSV